MQYAKYMERVLKYYSNMVAHTWCAWNQDLTLIMKERKKEKKKIKMSSLLNENTFPALRFWHKLHKLHSHILKNTKALFNWLILSPSN